MINHHQPIDRIFDIVKVESMNKEEMKDFFNKTFNSVGIQVTKGAMITLCHYSAGFPKIMHLLGDIIFWIDNDQLINGDDAAAGIIKAALAVGEKFVDQQVYKALQSKDYHSILKKISKGNSFQKGNIEKDLSEGERKKLHNFLRRMKKLNVLKSGDERGEYVFNSRLVRLYMLLKSL